MNPFLTTDRLNLRPLKPTDLDALYAYASDPKIDRFTPWRHYQSKTEARADLDEYLQGYEETGLGQWGVTLDDDVLIGIVSLSQPDPNHRKSEIGITIGRKHWGQGLATEAVSAILTFGLNTLKLARIEPTCLPENHASARVLVKSGMSHEGLMRAYQIWRDVPVDLDVYSVVHGDL